MCDSVSEINRKSWDKEAARYSAFVHSSKAMNRILHDPRSSFHTTVWKIIEQSIPRFEGLKVCVPSSGDNHAVFAFAILGAEVLSCDISQEQLKNAERVSSVYTWGKNIQYLQADTMLLEGVPDEAFDFVYTSNGVHVWIERLDEMYKNINRILKKDGLYLMYEVHPYTRPFGDGLKVIKPYDQTGPFEGEGEVNFHWRLMDIVNAISTSGLVLQHVEEMYPEKDYEFPLWLSLSDHLAGVKMTPEEVDLMYDWTENPAMAIPFWLSLTARK